MPANGRVVGLIDRKGIPADIQGAIPGYRAVLGGGIPNDGVSPSGGVSWIGVQPSAGSPAGNGTITGAGATAINNAWTTTRGYNTSIGNPARGTGPPYLWSVKLRMQTVTDDQSSQCQPSWLNSQTGIVTKSNGNVTIAASWASSGYRVIWQRFLAKLAAYIPTGETLSLANNDLLGEITFAFVTTAETLLVTPFTLTQMGNPSAATLLTTIENLLADAVAAFPNTYISFAFNPASYGGNTTTNTLLAWYLTPANVPFPKPGNNSGRANGTQNVSGVGVHGPFSGNDPNTGVPWFLTGSYSDGHGGTYTAMYQAIWLNGPGKFASQVGGPGFPIASPVAMYEQTSTLGTMGGANSDLENTLSYMGNAGNEMIELPSGYNTLTPAQLAPYAAILAANFNGPAPPAAGSSNLSWPAYRYKH